MHIIQGEQGDILILTPVIPTLDATVSNEFKDKIIQIVHEKKAKKVILDIYNIHFIDSAGLGSLLSVLRALKLEGAHLKLVKLNRVIHTMFELVSMQKVFETHDTLGEAIDAYKHLK